MFRTILQIIGILCGAVGIFGIFTDNMPLMIAGLTLVFLLSCCKKGSAIEHLTVRLATGPFFCLIGMLLVHCIGGIPWGMSLLYSAIFVYTIQAVSWAVMQISGLL